MHILGRTLPSERRRSSGCRVCRRIAADHLPSSSTSHSGFSAGVSELFWEGQQNVSACSLTLDQLAMQRKLCFSWSATPIFQRNFHRTNPGDAAS